MSDKVALQRSHTDTRAVPHRIADVGDELIPKTSKVLGGEVRLVRVEARKELGSLVGRRVVDQLFQVDAAGADQGRVELFQVVRREEEDALRGGRGDAVEGVEKTREGDVAVEPARENGESAVQLTGQAVQTGHTRLRRSALGAKTPRQCPREASRSAPARSPTGD